MTVRQDLKALKKSIKQDVRYKKLKKIFNDPDLQQYNIPFEEYIEEAKMRHRSRLFRRLDSASVKILDDITAASMEDANLRSRLTEFLVVAVQARKGMTQLIEQFEAYILMKYSGQMRPLLPTKEERKNFVSSVLDRFIEYRQNNEAFIEQIQVLIVDIDKANYSVKNMIDAQKLVYRPELARL